MFGSMPDEMFNHEPSSFDEAKRGYHGDAMRKMPMGKLVKILALIGVDTIEDAIKNIDGMSKDNYMHVLSMYEEDGEEERDGLFGKH